MVGLYEIEMENKILKNYIYMGWKILMFFGLMLPTSMHDVKEKILLGKKWDLWKGWNKEGLARIALGFDKM